MDMSTVGTRMAMPGSAEELVVTTSVTYPKDPGGGDERAGVWAAASE